jgi:DNA-binding response OmpR family regulator
MEALLRIAIIEDDAAIRLLLQATLADEGYEVLQIAGPGDVLAQLAAAAPDLVLLDLVLGRWGDGLALAQAIRKDPLLLDTPIVVMSAAVTVLQQHAEALDLLRCHVLEKPFDLDRLLGVIASALA